MMQAEIEISEIAAVTRSPGYIGIWLFLASETMLFVGLFGAYFVLSNENPLVFAQGQAELKFATAAFATAVLMFSGIAMQFAVSGRRIALLLSALAGLVFLQIAKIEYSELFHSPPEVTSIIISTGRMGFSGPSTNPHNNAFFDCFFTLTGVHAAHVLMGVIVMLILLPKMPQPAIRYLAMYWQFVDAVWICLFVIFYCI